MVVILEVLFVPAFVNRMSIKYSAPANHFLQTQRAFRTVWADFFLDVLVNLGVLEDNRLLLTEYVRRVEVKVSFQEGVFVGIQFSP